VLKRIATGDESWDEMVPPQAAEIIRRRGFFGYKKVKAVRPHSTKYFGRLCGLYWRETLMVCPLARQQQSGFF
jgi:hypothetical protein